MKSQSANFALVSARCSYRTAAGRQCRQLSADPRSGLCLHHRDLQQQKEADDLSDDLLERCQNFQTGQGINFALANIYRLLAENRISPRRASVLAYINSLMLRTFPAIDYDWKNGYKDPTLAEPVVAQPAPAPSSSAESAPSPAVHSSASPTNPLLQSAGGISSSSPLTNASLPMDSANAPSPFEHASIEPGLT